MRYNLFYPYWVNITFVSLGVSAIMDIIHGGLIYFALIVLGQIMRHSITIHWMFRWWTSVNFFTKWVTYPLFTLALWFKCSISKTSKTYILYHNYHQQMTLLIHTYCILWDATIEDLEIGDGTYAITEGGNWDCPYYY